MHITITGRLGSGKSTVAKILSEHDGYTYYSTGTIMRELAEEAGMSICDYNEMLKNNPEVDQQIDDRTRETAISRRDENIVFDSRMAWFFAPDTFKVYVTVDPAIAAARVKIDPRPGEPDSEVEIYRELEQRSRIEQARFIQFYGEGADYYNLQNYNLVVSSSHRTAEEVADVIRRALADYMADAEGHAHVEFL